jgi:hypothetical protein
MNNSHLLQILLAYSWAAVIALGSINHIYVMFGGIKKMDRHLSSMTNYEWESVNPAECFARLHKYSFLYTFLVLRPKVSIYMSAWLYFSCFGLIVTWTSLLYAALIKYNIFPIN